MVAPSADLTVLYGEETECKMKQVSAEIVEQTWKRVGSISPEDAPATIDEMGREQPFVLAYLTGVAEGRLTKDEQGLHLHIGIVAWQAMKEGGGELPMVSGEDLDNAEANNSQMLEFFQDEPEAGFYDGVQTLFKSYNQYEIMKYILEALMEEPEEGVILRDESIGPMFMYLKTVLDAMDR